MNELQDLRDQIDDFLANHPQSPLTWEQQAAFRGLDYYDDNDELIFTAPVERFSADEPLIEMETSTGDSQAYRRWGRFQFQVDGEAAALTIYTDPHEQEFFMPFRDTTSGKETYGAGRYMDSQRPGLQPISETEVAIDFNFCYNPYCAYNDNYSCPLPPVENWLKVPIRAGEKRFDH